MDANADVDKIMYIAVAILNNTSYQLIFTIGIISAFGFIVGLMNSAFYRLVGYRFGRVVCYATGFIGTPVHEIGHALFCIIFRHKIIEMKLYQPNSEDGTLGYVNHAFNPKSIYQQIGNFFIGLGPILFGSAVVLLLMCWFVPSLYEAFRGSTDFSGIETLDEIFSLSALKLVFDIMWGATLAFYNSSDLGSLGWWIFMIPACSVALHMSLSVPDIKGSWIGLGFIVLTLLAANTALYLLSAYGILNVDGMLTLTGYCLTAGAFILNFLTISVVFSLILFLLGIAVRVIRKIRGD